MMSGEFTALMLLAQEAARVREADLASNALPPKSPVSSRRPVARPSTRKMPGLARAKKTPVLPSLCLVTPGPAPPPPRTMPTAQPAFKRPAPPQVGQECLDLRLERPQQREDEDDDVELEILHDGGINRLFPNEPELSKDFKDYLLSLREGPRESIIASMKNPPIKLVHQGKRPTVSYCFITKDDLAEINKELQRMSQTWPSKMYTNVQNHLSETHELLSSHEYLVSHVLQAKEDFVKEYIQAGNRSGSPTDEFVLGGDMERARENLFWQTGMFNDLYRQTLKMPSKIEKRIDFSELRI